MSNKTPDENFEVVTTAEVRRRYALAGIQAEAVAFRDSDVPEPLRHLIPLARTYGVGDDVLREDLVRAATAEHQAEMKRRVAAADDDLDRWLTDPDELREPSTAYLAFSALRMAADIVR